MKKYKDALLTGEKTYLGRPCKKDGHAGIRFVSNRTCVLCTTNSEKTVPRRTYLQEYRKTNTLRTYQKQYQQQYMQTERYKTQKKDYRTRNAAKGTARTMRYQAAKINRTPGWLDADDYWMIEQAYELAAMRTQLFGFAWHVDHIVPLQGALVSGLHTPYNLQVIPAKDNQSKSNQFNVL